MDPPLIILLPLFIQLRETSYRSDELLVEKRRRSSPTIIHNSELGGKVEGFAVPLESGYEDAEER